VAIDVASRVVLGLSVSLDAPSVVSVALALTHAVLPKDIWLADRELEVPWPMVGVPDALHLDNAPEFHSAALARGAQEYGMRLTFRPPAQPHFGGHIERLIGTMMGAVHLLPGTTFSDVVDKGDYRPEDRAALTLTELERWLTLEIAGVYHHAVHTALGMSPLAAWHDGLARRGEPPRQPRDRQTFFLDFLPGERRLVRRDGIQLFRLHYWDNVLSPWAGRSREPMLIKYNPRNLSQIFLRDDQGTYSPIASILPLRPASEVRDGRLRRRVLGLTEGIMVRICRLMEAAAIQAIETGHERIDLGLLTEDLTAQSLVSMSDRRRPRPTP
jgi:putative transposase